MNEITIAINKDARVAVQAIANGARIGITIESLDKIPEIAGAVPELTPEKVRELIEKQKVLERQVHQSLLSLGQPAPSLLTENSSMGTTQQKG